MLTAFAAEAATATQTNWLYSPGFGGVMALLAAGVAFFAAHRTINSHRTIETDRRDKEQSLADQDRCWEMFRWAVEDGRLDPFTVLGVLKHLRSEAKRLDDKALLGVLSTYTQTALKSVLDTGDQ